ncbi:hypothetical protein EYF80_044820 [Liparis tanakae]|uniref:Uncharacterized protein n=1 Tax=Liparis tanakae TaxID=230148 RepID=A0A4Z2FUT4_9TELE|nr:hypothetical protein EYF80_044820 [Liparis tanakae]
MVPAVHARTAEGRSKDASQAFGSYCIEPYPTINITANRSTTGETNKTMTCYQGKLSPLPTSLPVLPMYGNAPPE